MTNMTTKQEKVNAALWRIGMVKGAKAVEMFVKCGADLTDEVKNLSGISQIAYLQQWTEAMDSAYWLFPSLEKEMEDMYHKVFDKCLPF